MLILSFYAVDNSTRLARTDIGKRRTDMRKGPWSVGGRRDMRRIGTGDQKKALTFVLPGTWPGGP